MADSTNNNAPQSAAGDSFARYIEAMSLDTEGTLKSINVRLQSITNNDGILISQSSLRDLAQQESQAAARGARSATTNRSSSESRNASGRGNQSDYPGGYTKRDVEEAGRTGRKRGKSFFDDVTDEFEKSFKEAAFGPAKQVLEQSVANFAKQLDTDVSNLGKKVGELLGKKVGDAFKDSPIGKQLSKEWKDIGNQFSKMSSDFANQAADWLKKGQQSASSSNSDSGGGLNPEDIIDTTATIEDMATGARDFVGKMGKAGEGAATASKELSVVGQTAAKTGTGLMAAGESAGALEAGAAAAGTALPVLTLAIVAGAIVIDKFTECFGPAIEGFKKWAGALKSAGNYVQDQNRKNIEYYNERVKADYDTIVKKPFELLAEAAETAYSTWDNVLKTVSATQGYDKAGVQSLWSNFAQRLKDENLDSVVSSADIMGNLESVLKQGLSGKVAEEFAYIATTLNNAIPTEDFFQYASTYASIAANAVKNGADQEEALKIANSELGSFASNLLYASRELSGGFSTKLTNAASLFEESTKIAMTSRTGDISNISGVLTSVAATVGAIAPDLADGIVSAVTSAAMGGNSPELTALRSLAGVGASNTAFLQELARNPQKIFSTLFSNLAGMQGMSKDNYMEVAEALSQVFGISMDAFARVDFDYLAKSIDSMQLNDKSLQQNMEALVSGQTTTNEEQLKMQQINQYMIDEGLAYVLDNEVARSIQQHMWDEQMKRELQATTYAVDIQGGALEFLQGIKDTADNIRNFLNPVSWFKKAGNMIMQTVKAEAMHQDLSTIVEQGKVGNGNTAVLKNLTANSPQKLDVGQQSYVTLMGAQSAVKSVDAIMAGLNTVTHQTVDGASKIINGANAIINKIAGGSSGGGGGASFGTSSSKYNFNMVGKSAAGGGSGRPSRTSSSVSTVQLGVKDKLGATYTYKDENGDYQTVELGKLFTEKGLNAAINDYVATTVSKGTALEEAVRTSYSAAKDKRSIKGAAKAAAKKAAEEATNEAARKKVYDETYAKLEKAALAKKKLDEEEKKLVQAAIDAGYNVKSSNGIYYIEDEADIMYDVYANKKGNIVNRDTGLQGAVEISAAESAKFASNVLSSAHERMDSLRSSATSTAEEIIDSSQAIVETAITLTADEIQKLKEQANAKADAAMNKLYEKTEASTLKAKLAELTTNPKAFNKSDTFLSSDVIESKLGTSTEDRSFTNFLQGLASQMSTESNFAKASPEDVITALSQFGYTEADLENMYNERQTEATAQKEHAKELREEQLWEDIQTFIDGYFPVDFVEQFLTSDWMLNWEINYLTPIKDDLHKFLENWESYYIHHSAYGDETREAYKSAQEVAKKEKSGTGNAVLALAEALTKDTLWKQQNAEALNDPVLQTNVLLSQILIVAEAIRNQTNESSIVSIPSALQALSLGVTTPTGTKK